MNRTQLLLLKLIEETNEVSAIASQSMQFGLESNRHRESSETNREVLIREVNNQLAIIDLLNEEYGLNIFRDEDLISKNKDKIREHLRVSKQLGLVH